MVSRVAVIEANPDKVEQRIQKTNQDLKAWQSLDPEEIDGLMKLKPEEVEAVKKLPGAAGKCSDWSGQTVCSSRVVSKDGAVHLANRYVLAAEILGGRRVGIRIEDNTLMFFDPHTRELLRTRPSPLTWDQACRLWGASPAGPPPRPSAQSARQR